MNMALNRPAQYFSLRWNNYQNTMTSVFQQLREDQSFVDVTLSCENGSLKAHKVSMVLSSIHMLSFLITCGVCLNGITILEHNSLLINIEMWNISKHHCFTPIRSHVSLLLLKRMYLTGMINWCVKTGETHRHQLLPPKPKTFLETVVP